VPIDIRKLKEFVQQESSRLNLRAYSTEGETTFTMALALSAGMKKIFYDKSKTVFSDEPRLEKKVITQFVHKMRVDAMEKFNSTTVFSAIQFAATEEDLQRRQYILTLIVYMERKFLPEFLRLLQYPYIDSDEDLECKDGCGSLVNLIAGQYKREIALLGYRDLMISPFESFINTSPDGVGIPKEVAEKYEISFELEGIKRLVVEMVTLDMMPSWKAHEKTEAKRILVIDDDVTFTKTFEPFLRSQGFEVIVANDGEEGIKKLKTKPHLIILDISMPIMDGYEFGIEKKRIEGAEQIPVIVLTAREGVSDMVKVEGAREYLLKSFQPATLLKSIQRCI